MKIVTYYFQSEDPTQGIHKNFEADRPLSNRELLIDAIAWFLKNYSYSAKIYKGQKGEFGEYVGELTLRGKDFVFKSADI